MGNKNIMQYDNSYFSDNHYRKIIKLGGTILVYLLLDEKRCTYYIICSTHPKSTVSHVHFNIENLLKILT